MLTRFGRYLRGQGAVGIYLTGTAVLMFVFLAADIAVKLTAVYKLAWLSYVVLALLLYSLINFITLIKNVVELVCFYLAFEATHGDKAR